MHADSNFVQSANIRLLERDSPDHDYYVTRNRRRLWFLRCMEEGATDGYLRSFLSPSIALPTTSAVRPRASTTAIDMRYVPCDKTHKRDSSLCFSLHNVDTDDTSFNSSDCANLDMHTDKHRRRLVANHRHLGGCSETARKSRLRTGR
jgi:hypothetical protein